MIHPHGYDETELDDEDEKGRGPQVAGYILLIAVILALGSMGLNLMRVQARTAAYETCMRQQLEIASLPDQDLQLTMLQGCSP